MEGWKEVTLIDLAQYINGFAFKPTDWNTEGLPIIRIEQLKNPKSVSDYCSFSIPDYNIINNGDLIFSWSASLFLKIWQDGKAALNQHLFKVLPFESTDKLFLKYLIEAHLVEITKTAQGSTMQHITRKNLEQYTLYVPKELTEQHKIAEILCTLDKAIEQTEILIAKYKNIKKGLIHDLLTYGIDSNGNIRNPQTHNFVKKNGMVVPEEWEVVEINEIATFGNGSDYKHLKEGNIPVFGTGGYMTSVNDYLYDGETVCVGRKGTIDQPQYHSGKIWTVDTLFYTHSFKNIVPKLLYFIFQQINWKNYNEATGVPSLSKKTISRIKISIPTILEEQQKIISIIEQKDKLIEYEESNVAKLQKQKQGLMQDLLTGKVRVKI